MSRNHILAGAVALIALVAAPGAMAQSVQLEARPLAIEDKELWNGILYSMTGPDIVTRDASGPNPSVAAYRVSSFLIGSAVGMYVDRMEVDSQGTYAVVQRKLLVYADEAGVPEPDFPGGISIIPGRDAPLVRWTSPTSFIYRVWDGRERDPLTYRNFLVEGVDGDTFTVRRAR